MEDFDLRKFLIENKLTTNSRQLDEGWKDWVAGGAMALSTLAGAAQTSQPTTTTTTPTQTTQTTTQTAQKPMFGTPEQRAAAAEKRKQNRTNIFNNFIKGAYYAEGCVEEVSDEEYASGCKGTDNDGTAYIEGTSTELPEYVYRELQDGTKLKIDLKKYGKIINRRSKSAEVGLDGLQDPQFNSGKSCGIAKAGDRANRRDWKKK